MHEQDSYLGVTKWAYNYYNVYCVFKRQSLMISMSDDRTMSVQLRVKFTRLML